MNVRPLHPLFAAELEVDLRHVDDAAFAQIQAAMDRYAVCVIHHDVPLTNEEHIAFTRRFGPIEGKKALPGTPLRMPTEIIDQSNLNADGEIFADDDKQLAYNRANQLWHTDMSFYALRATYSLLSAHAIPPPASGADTEFADARAAYDALPDAMKDRIADLVAEHDYYYSRVLGGGPEATPEERAMRPPAAHPLVSVHPRTGRKVLYVASHAFRIHGMPDDEARALIRELIAWVTQPRFVFRHVWQVGDVVIWDNLATLHRGTPYDDRHHVRDVRRTTVRELTLSS